MPPTRRRVQPAAIGRASPSPAPVDTSCSTTATCPVARAQPPPSKFDPVPTYRIDLSVSPERRWDEIGRKFAPLLHAAVDKIEPYFRGLLGDWLVSALMAMCGLLCWLGLFPHAAELRGLARSTGVTVGRLAVIQLVYEATSACTSVVVDSSSAGVPVHVRTMDWNMPFDLRPMTVNVEFWERGSFVFAATTWAGFVGIFTGMRADGFSVSVNYRLCGGSVLRNLGMIPLLAWPVSTFVRHVLTHAASFEEARAMVDRAWLLAPCYIIIAGTSPGEACLFTRRRCGHEHPRTLHEHGAIVQCNTDHWECDPLVDILESAERRDTAAEMVGRLGRAKLGPTDAPARADALPGLWNFLHTAPIENDITVYATVMVPARGAEIPHTLPLFSVRHRPRPVIV